MDGTGMSFVPSEASMYMWAWIGCITVIVVALLVNDRPITIATSDEPVFDSTYAPEAAGRTLAR
jgi:hypothetical protein